MENARPIVVEKWQIPRPSLTGSSAGTPRGSASSQGSSSNHSTQSACSGSLLLNAAQLARARDVAEPSTFRANLTAYVDTAAHKKLQRTDAVVAIPEEVGAGGRVDVGAGVGDPFWKGVKRGAAGPGSVASSTHFTVVNGFTKHRAVKEAHWCCNRSHQVTVLVLTMTLLFTACILAAVCFVEMRLRKDSGYRYT